MDTVGRLCPRTCLSTHMDGRCVALCVAYAATGKTQKYSVSKRHTDAHDTCPVLETSRLDDSITHTHAADGARSLH